MVLRFLERALPSPLRPTRLLRLLARVAPGPVRGMLARSAQGYLPAIIYSNRFSQALAPELFSRGMKLYRGPYRLHVPLHLLPEYRTFEPVTIKRFLSSLTPGMTVVDVGANVGYYTLTAARAVGPTGTVHAIEPCDTNLALLRRNVESSELRNVQVHSCAAGRKHAQRRFHITESSFDHGFYPHPFAKTVREVLVDQIPLDDLVRTPVDIVKIDVEGSEIEVIDGMRRILRENSHLSLFVEWSPCCMKEAGREAHELPDQLHQVGFRDLRVLDDLGRRECSVSDILDMLRDRPEKIWYGMIWARSLCAESEIDRHAERRSKEALPAMVS